MPTISCKVTNVDCSEIDRGVLSPDQIVGLLHSIDWEEQERLLGARLETDESCHPGLELTTSDGRNLNVLPEEDDEIYIFHRYPKPGTPPNATINKENYRTAQILLPRAELLQFLNKLAEGDHEWIVSKSFRPAVAMAGLISLGAAVVGFIVGGTWLLLRLTGVDPDSNMSARDLVMFLVWMVLMIFLACVLWLSLAKIFLTREEANTGWTFYGRGYKIDQWFFNLFFPERS